MFKQPSNVPIQSERQASRTATVQERGVEHKASHKPVSAPEGLACSLTCPAFMVLDFEGLLDFKPVDTQFQVRGVTFSGPIALRPSNPAFPAHSGSMVLLAPQEARKPIEAIFSEAVSFIGVWVTASRPVVMSAYDAAGELIAQTELPEANLGYPGTELTPNQFLSVRAPGIRRVSFVCNDGNLVLDDFTLYPAPTPMRAEATV